MIKNLKKLIIRSDRLKTVTRQFGADNPFSLFRDVLNKIFENISFNSDKTNVTAEGDIQEQKIAWTDVQVEPLEPIEGLEFR
ncbi:unnamed protein product [Meloidogyne enterolobii]|uniref:Uncharacterized protein n=1 Tax=Meloidogyne enterolobii TaxID=390850 RepID=A0ACB0ZEW8_MELEN